VTENSFWKGKCRSPVDDSLTVADQSRDNGSLAVAPPAALVEKGETIFEPSRESRLIPGPSQGSVEVMLADDRTYFADKVAMVGAWHLLYHE